MEEEETSAVVVTALDEVACKNDMYFFLSVPVFGDEHEHCVCTVRCQSRVCTARCQSCMCTVRCQSRVCVQWEVTTPEWQRG